MRQADEPTVEEILASIKKVIARDNRDAAAANDLRQREAEARVDRAAAREDEARHDEDVLDLAEVEAIEQMDEDGAGACLIGEATRASMHDSLAALAMLAEPGARPQIVRSGETSLEGLVRDMLRPMLAQWLENNLPPLVERMVAAEIARIVGKQA